MSENYITAMKEKATRKAKDFLESVKENISNIQGLNHAELKAKYSLTQLVKKYSGKFEASKTEANFHIQQSIDAIKTTIASMPQKSVQWAALALVTLNTLTPVGEALAATNKADSLAKAPQKTEQVRASYQEIPDSTPLSPNDSVTVILPNGETRVLGVNGSKTVGEFKKNLAKISEYNNAQIVGVSVDARPSFNAVGNVLGQALRAPSLNNNTYTPKVENNNEPSLSDMNALIEASQDTSYKAILDVEIKNENVRSKVEAAKLLSEALAPSTRLGFYDRQGRVTTILSTSKENAGWGRNKTAIEIANQMGDKLGKIEFLSADPSVFANNTQSKPEVVSNLNPTAGTVSLNLGTKKDKVPQFNTSSLTNDVLGDFGGIKGVDEFGGLMATAQPPQQEKKSEVLAARTENSNKEQQAKVQVIELNNKWSLIKVSALVDEREITKIKKIDTSEPVQIPEGKVTNISIGERTLHHIAATGELGDRIMISFNGDPEGTARLIKSRANNVVRVYEKKEGSEKEYSESFNGNEIFTEKGLTPRSLEIRAGKTFVFDTKNHDKTISLVNQKTQKGGFDIYSLIIDKNLTTTTSGAPSQAKQFMGIFKAQNREGKLAMISGAKNDLERLRNAFARYGNDKLTEEALNMPKGSFVALRALEAMGLFSSTFDDGKITQSDFNKLENKIGGVSGINATLEGLEQILRSYDEKYTNVSLDTSSLGGKAPAYFLSGQINIDKQKLDQTDRDLLRAIKEDNKEKIKKLIEERNRLSTDLRNNIREALQRINDSDQRTKDAIEKHVASIMEKENDLRNLQNEEVKRKEYLIASGAEDKITEGEIKIENFKGLGSSEFGDFLSLLGGTLKLRYEEMQVIEYNRDGDKNRQSDIEKNSNQKIEEHIYFIPSDFAKALSLSADLSVALKSIGLSPVAIKNFLIGGGNSSLNAGSEVQVAFTGTAADVDALTKAKNTYQELKEKTNTLLDPLLSNIINSDNSIKLKMTKAEINTYLISTGEKIDSTTLDVVYQRYLSAYALIKTMPHEGRGRLRNRPSAGKLAFIKSLEKELKNNPELAELVKQKQIDDLMANPEMNREIQRQLEENLKKLNQRKGINNPRMHTQSELRRFPNGQAVLNYLASNAKAIRHFKDGTKIKISGSEITVNKNLKDALYAYVTYRGTDNTVGTQYLVSGKNLVKITITNMKTGEELEFDYDCYNNLFASSTFEIKGKDRTRKAEEKLEIGCEVCIESENPNVEQDISQEKKITQVIAKQGLEAAMDAKKVIEINKIGSSEFLVLAVFKPELISDKQMQMAEKIKYGNSNMSMADMIRLVKATPELKAKYERSIPSSDLNYFKYENISKFSIGLPIFGNFLKGSVEYEASRKIIASYDSYLAFNKDCEAGLIAFKSNAFLREQAYLSAKAELEAKKQPKKELETEKPKPEPEKPQERTLNRNAKEAVRGNPAHSPTQLDGTTPPNGVNVEGRSAPTTPTISDSPTQLNTPNVNNGVNVDGQAAPTTPTISDSPTTPGVNPTSNLNQGTQIPNTPTISNSPTTPGTTPTLNVLPVDALPSQVPQVTLPNLSGPTVSPTLNSPTVPGAAVVPPTNVPNQIPGATVPSFGRNPADVIQSDIANPGNVGF
jgi:hypothetical protein